MGKEKTTSIRRRYEIHMLSNEQTIVRCRPYPVEGMHRKPEMETEDPGHDRTRKPRLTSPNSMTPEGVMKNKTLAPM